MLKFTVFDSMATQPLTIPQAADASDSYEHLQSFSVGADRVAFFGELLIIDARHEMPDWTLREFARKPIYFREKKYALRSKHAAGKPYARRYVLEPWPENFAEVSRQFFLYDEATVNAREAAFRGEVTDSALHKVLLPLYPFLGFLWTGTKDKLAGVGFEPRSITAGSILVTFALLLPELALVGLILLVSSLQGHPNFAGLLRVLWGSPEIEVFGVTLPFWPIEFLVVTAATADFAMRFSQKFKSSDEAPWGFLEWLKPPPVSIWRRKKS